MSTQQILVLAFAALLAILMIVFLPYDVEHRERSLATGFSDRGDYQRVEYLPFWGNKNRDEQRAQSYGAFGGTLSYTEERSTSARVNSGRLALQFIALGALTAGLLFVSREPRGPSAAPQTAATSDAAPSNAQG